MFSDSFRRSTSEHSPLLLTSGRKMWRQMSPSRPTVTGRSLSVTVPSFHRADSSVSAFSASSSVSDDHLGPFSYSGQSEGRMDFQLPCPERLRGVLAAPQLLYSALWESVDVASLILKEVIYNSLGDMGEDNPNPISNFDDPTVKRPWRKRRTTLKVKNMGPNHRSQDVVTLQSRSVELVAKFGYGPLDFALTGETIEIALRSEFNESAPWKIIENTETDSSGKVNLTLDPEHINSIGIYKVRMKVLGDKSSTYSKLLVVPSNSKCVVFSIDGSFAASVSILGTDPRVRPAAVDVVRYWSDNGYLIMYISSRPDMQKNRVIQWLKQHNFPQGICFFAKGITHDPYGRKGTMLKNIISSCQLEVQAVYGSSKDVPVYSLLHLNPGQIFIIGRNSRKLATKCTILSDGYSNHLERLRCGERKNTSAELNPRLFFRQNSLSY
jgi:hypothetical protein